MRGSTLAHTKRDCVYRLVWIPTYRRKVLYGECRKVIGGTIRVLVYLPKDEKSHAISVFNEMYARGASKKVRNAYKVRAAAGELIECAPYGCLKDLSNSKRWIVDLEAAEVMRRVFALFLEGKGTRQIADIFSSEKVLIPKNHWPSKGIGKGGLPPSVDIYSWNHSSVEKVLKRQEYCGCIGRIDIQNAPRTCSEEIVMQTREGVMLQLADKGAESRKVS